VIDLLIPVLGRPQNAQPLVDSIHENTTVPSCTFFVCTRGDEDQIEACKRTGAVVLLIDPGLCEYARKINEAISRSAEIRVGHDFVFLGADDLRFHPLWAEKALELYTPATRVIGTNDIGNATVMRGDHATHSLVHRSYVELGTIDEPGRLLHEGYGHNYVDTEFIETAKTRGEFVFAAESIVEHLHPFWHKGPDDVIYRKGRKTVNRDHATYNRRRRLWQ
jgi:hypothetical protein